MNFGTRLKQLRIEKGLSQEELIKKAKLMISRNALSGYENNLVKPPVENAIVLAEFFDVSLNYLYGLSNSKREENQELVDSLGLSDKSIDALKKIVKKNDEDSLYIINEIISDEDFIKYFAEYLKAYKLKKCKTIPKTILSSDKSVGDEITIYKNSNEYTQMTRFFFINYIDSFIDKKTKEMKKVD